MMGRIIEPIGGAFECRQEIDKDADRWANAPGEVFP